MPDNEPVSFEKVRESFKSGELWKKTPKELIQCLRGLTFGAEVNPNIRHQYIIIASAIHSILLTHVLDEQEKRNKKTQFWFMILAITAICVAILQIVVVIWLNP